MSVDSHANVIALHPNPSRLGSGLVVADPDVDGLARQFIDSAYGSDQYANWPLDRCLEGFLQHRGLGHLADNGDLFTIICDRVMTNISYQRLHGGGDGEARAWPSSESSESSDSLESSDLSVSSDLSESSDSSSLSAQLVKSPASHRGNLSLVRTMTEQGGA